MADENDFERTEPASPRRREQAREEGQIARSRELATFAVLAAGGGGLWLAGKALFGKVEDLLREGLSFDRAAAFNPDLMLARLASQAWEIAQALAPLALLLLAAAFVSPLALGGWVFSSKPLQLDLGRLSPIKGLSRVFSWNGLADLATALAKATLIGSVAVWILWHHRDDVLSLASEPVETGIIHLGELLGLSFLAIAGSMILIVAADVPFQLWTHARKLRMTKEELRQELKETEGDPQIKARIRREQREAARRRMMEEIPKADVVVTNPTHYAVALRYQDKTMGAPRVVAKGAHLLAGKIREIAEANGVPILEAPPLARALYRHTDLGDEIPEALYTAVAEVLAYVYQLRRYRTMGAGVEPQPPRDLPVPPELDPEAT